jgi:hypothetical protein
MASIAPTLVRIKQDLSVFVPDPLVLQCCLDLGLRWRKRLLDPLTTLHLFVLQVLAFNTAITHLRHLGGMAASAAAYCKARLRLPLALLQHLLRKGTAAMVGQLPPGGWCGLRPFLIDCSSTITPDTPALDKFFGHPTGQKRGCGFPVAKVLGVFDAFSGLVIQTLCFALFVHEMSRVWRVHPLLGEGDLLVGDRGFCSYAHLALLRIKKVAAVFRLHGRRRESDWRCGRTIKRLGPEDRIVRWEKPAKPPVWMSREQFEQLPQTLELRLVRYRLPAEKGRRTRQVIVATTLLDPLLYPAAKLAELYGVRWRAETHFAQLKTLLRMRKLKCQSVEGVQKELAIYCLVYNLVHMVMLRAAQRQGVTPDRIGFLDTVRWLLSAAPAQDLPDLVVNPRRPGRHEPRVIKDLQDTYRKMTRSRTYLRTHQELTRR